MDKTKLAALPVLFGFFVMGFCDIVGISSDYAASAFNWSPTMTGLSPSAVFIWFFFLGVPVGLLMNRIGRKNTVLLSCVVTVIGMSIPLISYSSVTTLVAYGLLGIGNAILQVSLMPLLNDVITNERLRTPALTGAQVVKAVCSFVGPYIVLLAVTYFGGGDEQKWYLCFPIMGAITLISGLWLWATPITEQNTAIVSESSISKTLALLKDKKILLLFFGIFFIVGVDVCTNTISSKVMISRFGYTKEMAGLAPQVYFVLRTIGAFFGVFMLTKVAERMYFQLNIVASIFVLLVLAFVENEIVNFICIGALGFLGSTIFPIIYNMAIRHRPDKTNEIAGLMIMAVAGGTTTFIMGAAIDFTGIAGGAIIILLEVIYLTFCAFKKI